MSFLFKGISSENYFITEKVRRELLPPISHVMFDIPGRPGAVHQKSSLGVRTFSMVIRIREENVIDLNEMIRSVADWLYSDTLQQLILTKEPNRYYMAALDGNTDLEEIVRIGKGTLTFIAPDPIAYNLNLNMIPIASGTETASLDIEGTYKTFPKVKATFNSDTTVFAYGTGNEYEQVLLGKPVDEENETSRPRDERVFTNEGTTIAPFTTGASPDVVDNGIIAGTMITDAAPPGRLTYSSLGTSTTQWHGPALLATLPEVYDNWRVDWYPRFNNINPKEIMKIELYLLDANGAELGKLALFDNWSSARDTYAQVRLGPKDEPGSRNLIFEHGGRPGAWNDFSGIIRLTKTGNVYDAYVALIKDGRHSGRRIRSYIDSNNALNQNGLAQMVLYIAGYQDHPAFANTRVYSNALYVWKRNVLADNEVDFVARSGDVLEVDHLTKEVTLNGEPYKEELNPISNLFSLNPGNNAIGFSPSDAANIEVTYRSRWL